jgi:DNA repair protein RadC
LWFKLDRGFFLLKIKKYTMDRRKEGHKKRIRERYRKDGLNGFHSYEVLELILSYSLVRKDTKRIAKDLIEKFGSLTDVFNAPFRVLKEVEGVGERTAVLLKLFKDTGDFHLKENIIGSKKISSPRDVYDYLNFHYKGKFKEEFIVIYLDTAHKVIDITPLFTGTIDKSAVYIRELIKEVLDLKSAALILAHNHPSGNINPSEGDIRVSKKIKKALSYIDVELIDHVICGDGNFYSLKEHGLL